MNKIQMNIQATATTTREQGKMNTYGSNFHDFCVIGNGDGLVAASTNGKIASVCVTDPTSYENPNDETINTNGKPVCFSQDMLPNTKKKRLVRFAEKEHGFVCTNTKGEEQTEKENNYPSLRDIFPKPSSLRSSPGEVETNTICVNAHQMIRVLQSLIVQSEANDSHLQTVTITSKKAYIQKDDYESVGGLKHKLGHDLQPVVLTGSAGFAVIMPVKSSDDKAKDDWGKNADALSHNRYTDFYEKFQSMYTVRKETDVLTNASTA